MKRILAAACAAALLALAGCGQKSQAAFSEGDLLLNVGGQAYHCRVNIDAVIADLGEDYEYAEGKSCNYDGLDKTFSYADARFYTNPLAEGDLVSEIYSESAGISTSKGISVGDPKEKVLSAYGEPAEDAGDLLIYRVSDEIGEPSLCFELENDEVAAIFLTMEAV